MVILEMYKQFDLLLKEINIEYRTTLVNFANYPLIMFAMAKIMEMDSFEQNKVALYLFNSIYSKIKNLIYTIRGKQVMLDSDVARLFKHATKDLNRNVKNNIDRFPEYYCFQLTDEEYKSLRCKNFTLNENGRG